MRELHGTLPSADLDAVLAGSEPAVLRGLVAHWPVVEAGTSPAGDVPAYLRRFLGDATVGAWFGPPEIEGRFDYTPDLSGLNFQREKLPLGAVLDALALHQADTHPPAIYVGSTTIDACLPGFRAENDVDLGARDVLASLWLGNRTRVAAHQDLPDNLACVAGGHRRFTLLPPGQVGNLYIGPLENTLAGQPTSLVDFKQPDMRRHPKFAEALQHAQVAELGPGDAIFIPSMWWHHVEATDAFNLLVNYWWRQSPGYMDSPMAALLAAILSVRELPSAQREAWRALFDHYVFEADEHTAGHIPAAARQVLGPLDDATTRALRMRIVRRLNR